LEKRSPHYKLAVVHALVEAGKLRATGTALAGGAALGLDIQGIVDVVMALGHRDFRKSMTTHDVGG
jgi:motility quorum-sensing regulator/GCU-specific mRNA interferase toxin